MFDLDGPAIAGRYIEVDAKAHWWRTSAAAKPVTCDLHSCSASRAAAHGPHAAPILVWPASGSHDSGYAADLASCTPPCKPS
jgi:hypothetical protein